MSRRKRPVARRSPPRTVEILLNGGGPFDGWAATCRADFPSRWIRDLESGDIDRMMGAMDKIVLDHNFPDEEGELAQTMADVDPWTGLVAVMGELTAAIGRLPPR